MEDVDDPLSAVSCHLAKLPHGRSRGFLSFIDQSHCELNRVRVHRGIHYETGVIVAEYGKYNHGCDGVWKPICSLSWLRNDLNSTSVPRRQGESAPYKRRNIVCTLYVKCEGQTILHFVRAL